MRVFSGSANESLATKVADALHLSLSPREIFIFPDLERRIMLQESVLDEDVVIIQSTNTPATENYMELFFLADAAQRNGAKSTTVVMPYMGYQRQDHMFRIGEAVSLHVIIKMLESLSVDRVIAFDLHSIKIPEFFNIPITHLSALSLFAEEIKKSGWCVDDSVLVSPDMGGIRRIEIISHMLGNMPYVTVEKNRDLATGSVEMAAVHGELEQKAIIIDDMISSGGTIVKAAELLLSKGAEEVYVFVTHPIFSKEAPTLLQESPVKKVFVTDTVHVPGERRFEKLEILSIAPQIAQALLEK